MSDFEVIRPLGQGGQATVYLVRRRMSNPESTEESLFCLKRIPCPTLPHLNTALLEVQACLRLSHPHIVRTLSFSLEPDEPTPSHPSPFFLRIISEYCNGRSLKTYIDRARRRQRVVAFDTILDFTEQLATALSYLRLKNILHRDIKPANLMLHRPDPDLRQTVLKVTDFGFAKTLVLDSDQATTTLGTPYYLAPEIKLQLGTEYDWRVDMWGLACVVLDLLLSKTVDFALEIGMDSDLVRLKRTLSERYDNDDNDVFSRLIQFIDCIVQIRVEDRPSPDEVILLCRSLRQIEEEEEEEEEDTAESQTSLSLSCSWNPLLSFSRPELEEKIRDLESEITNLKKVLTPPHSFSSTSFSSFPRWSLSRKHRDLIVSENRLICTRKVSSSRGNRNVAMDVEWNQIGKRFSVKFKYINEANASFHNAMVGIIDPYALVMGVSSSSSSVQNEKGSGHQRVRIEESSSASGSGSGSEEESGLSTLFSRTTKSIGGSMPFSWGLYLRDGAVYHERARREYVSDHQFGSGDVIEMIVDMSFEEDGNAAEEEEMMLSFGRRSMKEARLSYVVNGVDYGVAFVMTARAFCPAVTMYSATEVFVVL